ncbi:hypothetical protein NKG94_50205 [Micromonospora sp. M12]
MTLPTDLPPVAEADGRGVRLRFHLDETAAEATTGLARECG